MRSTTFLPALAVLAKLSTAAYTLQQDFGVSSFFDNFAFFTVSFCIALGSGLAYHRYTFGRSIQYPVLTLQPGH